MKRLGTLIVFKPDVTREQAEKALAALAGLVEPKITYPHTCEFRGMTIVDHGKPERTDDPAKHIETFDDTYGGPGFYIP